ncbi:MAG: anthranilate synthase component II [Bacillota bacterium]
MILIIDNYDSFTYNLVQYTGMINPDVKVIRNDRTGVEGIREMRPSHIILSPGPGYPCDAGICMDVIKELGAEIPILGVCLGHQSIGAAFGGRVSRAPGGPVHGKKTPALIDTSCPVFSGLPDMMGVGRYHSLVVERGSLPAELAITATTEDGIIMGLMHKSFPVFGIQFHPESLLTDNGFQIMQNFLSYGSEGGYSR